MTADRHTARTARTAKVCESCERRIKPGERYLRWVTFPSDGLLDTIASCAECAACARRHGRAALLEATP